jgi:sulfoxide reductase heme-binding subunit YedZ
MKPVNRAVFVISLFPLIWLIGHALFTGLGANPVERVLHQTGDWALNFLLITLTVSPLQRLTGREWIGNFRKMMGLFAFFYASLHFITYVALDQFFSWTAIVEDVVQHKRIIVGFASYTFLILLALTSTRRMAGKLAAARWQALHQFVYLAAIAAVIHYLWLVKRDMRTPLIYAAVLALLLLYRGVRWLGRRWSQAAHQG